MTAGRLGYDGIVATVPVSVPYVLYSIRSAHWWLGKALGALVRGAGMPKQAIDGLCVSSFTLAPDTAVGLTQHLGMSPRWLDHIPTGGASGVMALRRRSEEHTSELQSLMRISYAVFCLKKKHHNSISTHN